MASQVKVEELAQKTVDTEEKSVGNEEEEEAEIKEEFSSDDDEEGVSQSALAKLLNKFLGIGSAPAPEEKVPSKGVLRPDQLNLKGVAEGIKKGLFKKIIVMTGAGISVAAGIPDFRSPKTGLYATMNLQKYNLNQPEDIFTIGSVKIYQFLGYLKKLISKTPDFSNKILNHFVNLPKTFFQETTK